MKSLYFKLTLWTLATLIVSVVGTSYAVNTINRNFTGRPNGLSRSIDWQMDQAVRAYESGGPAKLAEHMTHLERFFRGGHYLLDGRSNRDLLTGEDRSALLPGDQAPPRLLSLPGMPHRFVIARSTADGKYRYLASVEPPFNQSNAVLPFAIVFLSISVFSYALFRYLASPLRELSLAVERFGQGDFAARVSVRRSDEIGALAARYNQMAERIQTLLAAERRLLEDVSHELRSPLARLQFALELFRSSPDRESGIARMRREVDRLGELVGQLLEVTRAEGDPDARVREDVDLTELTQSIVEDCRIEAEAKRCQLRFRHERSFLLWADRELLRRAVENVLRNAIRYAPEGTAIDVALSKEVRAAALVVRDFGPGVPEEMIGKIFQPFFRVDSSRTSSTGGVGLGLAIAQRAVALHQGHVKAENAQPGLRVKIELPLAA